MPQVVCSEKLTFRRCPDCSWRMGGDEARVVGNHIGSGYRGGSSGLLSANIGSLFRSARASRHSLEFSRLLSSIEVLPHRLAVLSFKRARHSFARIDEADGARLRSPATSPLAAEAIAEALQSAVWVGRWFLLSVAVTAGKS